VSSFERGEGEGMIKNLLKGAVLETVLLNLIESAKETGLHGYAIFREIKRKFGVSVGPSLLYPELKQLEKKGLIAPSWEIKSGKARKRYTITPSGQRVLREYFAELRVIMPACTQMKANPNPLRQNVLH
jgi:DNA-binding PadR family transcriptional regulator